MQMCVCDAQCVLTDFPALMPWTANTGQLSKIWLKIYTIDHFFSLALCIDQKIDFMTVVM